MSSAMTMSASDAASSSSSSTTAAAGQQPLTGSARYKKLEKLGEGVYGVVYKALDKVTNKFVAMKKVPLRDSDEGIPATSLREISLLKMLNHENVVSLVDVVFNTQAAQLYLVMEHASSDLKKYMDKHNKKLSAELVKKIMYQIVAGMHYCHKNGVLHRDLKPANILISNSDFSDPNPVLKLADFGLARAVANGEGHFTHEVVTLWYRSPEVLLGGPEGQYSSPLDMWSIGCIFAELATGHPFLTGDSEIGQLMAIFSVLGTPNEDLWPGVGTFPDFKNTFPKWKPKALGEVIPQLDVQGLDLLSKMFVYDPRTRISAKKAMMHPYFDDVRKANAL